VEGVWEVVGVVVVEVWVAGGLEVWELVKEGRRSLKNQKKLFKTFGHLFHCHLIIFNILFIEFSYLNI
jgi:hypothetical protein